MKKIDKIEKILVIITGVIFILLTAYMLMVLSSEKIEIPSSIPLGKSTSNVAIRININY